MLIGLVSLVLLAAPAVAEDPPATTEGTRSPEALEILKKVDAKVKGISAVRYKVKAVPGGAAEQTLSPAEGSALIVGWTGRMPEKFLVEGKTEINGEPVVVTGGGNGDTFFVIDHTTKKGYEDMDPAVLGSSARVLFALAMLEFVHDRPFDDELNAETLEMLENETVAGEECYKIRVVYAGGQGESIWLFSKSDYTPRGRIQLIHGPQGEGTIERTIYDLELDPEIDEQLFVMQLPEGYEQIDDFAP
jgi:outer membrane lipoprotein-sorting protein